MPGWLTCPNGRSCHYDCAWRNSPCLEGFVARKKRVPMWVVLALGLLLALALLSRVHAQALPVAPALTEAKLFEQCGRKQSTIETQAEYIAILKARITELQDEAKKAQ